MGIEYEEESEGAASGGRWAVHALLRCDGCNALLARGVARRPVFPTEREAGASRSEALSKAVYRAGLIPGVVAGLDGATLRSVQCAACAREGAAAPLVWSRDLGRGDAVAIGAIRRGDAWEVSLVFDASGIRHQRRVTVASADAARDLAAEWLSGAAACAAEVRAMAARHPQAATRAKAEGAGVRA